MGVGGRKVHGRWDAVAVDDQVILGAGLSAIGRIGAGLLTPLFARTLKLSTLALDQPIAASSPNQLRSVSCNRRQTSASCQSRSRRQQVAPLPQPSSLGNSRQGAARAQDEDDAAQRGSVWNTGPTAFRLRQLCWQERFYSFPKGVRNKRCAHNDGPSCHPRPVLQHALRGCLKRGHRASRASMRLLMARWIQASSVAGNAS